MLYCSAALTCLGAKQPGNKALGPGLEMPFFDFGNVRFSRDHDEMPEAGTVVATLEMGPQALDLEVDVLDDGVPVSC